MPRSASTRKKLRPPDRRIRISSWSIERYRSTVNPDKEAFNAAVEDLKSIYESIKSLVETVHGGDSSEAVDDAVHRLYQLATLNYFRLRFPLLYWLGQPLGFVNQAFTTETIPEPVGSGISAFVSAPRRHFLDLYRDNWPIETEAQASALSHATFAPLAVAIGFWEKALYKLLNKIHLGLKLPPRRLLYGWEPSPGSTTPLGDQLANRTLSFSFFGVKEERPPPPAPGAEPWDVTPPPPPTARVEGEVTCSLAWVPREHGGPGLFVALGGAEHLEAPLAGDWRIQFSLGSASAIDFLIRDWNKVAIGGPADASASVTITRPPETSGERYVLSVADGVRLEFGRLSFGFALGARGPAARLVADQCALVIEAKRDPVLERAKSADHLRLDLSLGLGFADGSFYLDGGTGLTVTKPIGKSLGPLRVPSVTLALTPSTSPDAPDLHFEAAATVIVKLGPVTFTVDRVGLSASVDFSDRADLGYQAPKGIGVEIDSALITGGGYLFYDRKKGQYAGVLDFATDWFSVKAIGLLQTKGVDRNLSFLVILAVEDFEPWPLAFGFKLTGIGGLFGYDRTVNVEALKGGIKNRTLDRIMFPPDPVANAAAIVEVVSTVFPPARDRTVVGPFMQIAWGAEELVTIELGLVLELPTPARLVILGKLRALFPHKDAAIIKIEVDLVGEIDLDRKQAFAHAVLVRPSKLAGFPLLGDAALLWRWGGDPVFVLAFGGVNKRYERQLPAAFPKLERLSIPLTNSKNRRLRLEAYVAVTSNSFQIGGKLDFYAKKGKFSVEGWLIVDALFQSNQPCIVLDFDAKLQLKAWGVNLFKVRVVGMLSGTKPWHVVGKATFEIWWIDYSVGVDLTFGGDDAPPASVPQVEISVQLLAALRDPRSWSAQLPDPRQSLVTLRSVRGMAEVLLHPLSTLSVTQRVVPLGVTVTRFGNARPRGAAKFRIDRVTVNGDEVEIDETREHFARAQFFDMNEDEKLASPAFERMPAGVQVKSAGVAHGAAVQASMQYETLIYDAAAGQTTAGEPHVLSEERFADLAQIGAAAVFAPVHAGRTKYRAPARGIAVSALRYAVATTDALTVQAIAGTRDGVAQSFTEATDALRAHVARQPGERRNLQVVRLMETVS